MKLGRMILPLAAFCGVAWSQTGLTTVQDTLFNADGTRFNGTLTISWNTFDAVNIGTIVQQSKIVAVVNGNLQVQLAPNATATPPANVYTVRYQSGGSQQFSEAWSVPVSVRPLALSSVRISPQSNSGGANNNQTGGTGSNQTTFPESAIVGLQADLAQRPLKGVAFGTNSVAIVDDSGNLATAVGDPGECVLVDGTAAQCNPPTFSDAETPGGAVDGTNNQLTLAGVPLGLSLLLFRNGLYLTPNLDYTLSGSTITFVPGAVPQSGDTLTANYRVDTLASTDIGGFNTGNTSLHTAAAQVVCSAAGFGTNATSLTTLGGCDIPAAGLNAGDSFDVRFTFAHAGTPTGFVFQVNWGNTAIVMRTAGAKDAAVAGHVEAGVTASGAAISAETWGTLLPFMPAVLNVSQQQGLEVTFQAALAAAGADTVTLTSYTVLRYPAH